MSLHDTAFFTAHIATEELIERLRCYIAKSVNTKKGGK